MMPAYTNINVRVPQKFKSELKQAATQENKNITDYVKIIFNV